MALFGKPDVRNMDDVSLIAAVISGDQEAIVHFFYKKFSATFQYHIYSLFQRREDVSELVDEFFLYMYEDDWRRLRSYDSSKAALSTWISTVSFRFFKNYKNTKIDYNGVISISDKWETFRGDWVQSHEAGMMMDIRDAIEEVKNERDREIAKRIFLEDAEFEKVAEEFNLTVDYVYTVKNRLIKQLKKVLNAYERQ